MTQHDPQHIPAIAPAPADTTVAPADTAAAVAPVPGIVLADPHAPAPPADMRGGLTGASWILTALLAVFCIVCLRYQNNGRYFKTLIADLTDVRDRRNLFDDTVRETSFLVLLNVLACCTSGLTVCMLLRVNAPAVAGSATAMAASMLCAAVYSLFMPCACWAVGTVFAGRAKAASWLKGYAASQGLFGICAFAPAVAGLFYPQAIDALLICILTVFAAAKTIFIVKGFRIFLTESSSWVLFLYYLCGLEIVPLILTYSGALELCLLMR